MNRIAANLAELAVPIGSLIPYPGNARVHADATLAESLQVNQQYRPLVVQRSTNRILAGNGTWKAALALGWTEVAATYIDCDDATATRIVLVDNRASDLASYDDAALRAILSEVPELPGTGYSAEDITALLAQLPGGNGLPEPTPAKPMGPSVDVGGSVIITSEDARHLSLESDSVDLIVTSPPYFGLRSYQDAGQHYVGQVGAEEIPEQYLESLWECTREWMRVLKPTGSLWVNLGDKYSAAGGGGGSSDGATGRHPRPKRKSTGVAFKSLLGLPWRYAIGCTDQLGLILRAEVIWSKPNGLPESVTDRVRRSHEQWFHFVLQSKYYSATDEIREEYKASTLADYGRGRGVHQSGKYAEYATGNRLRGDGDPTSWRGNPLGKLSGSVWEIGTQPLAVPVGLSDHFAAFPTELPRRIILGWSPPGICTVCGEGYRPVVNHEGMTRREMLAELGPSKRFDGVNRQGLDTQGGHNVWRTHSLIGHACACTPYVDHPGTGGSSGKNYAESIGEGKYPNAGRSHAGWHDLGTRPKVGPHREYRLNDRTPPQTTPAVVLDPFGGTGTTALVASVLGRTGISNDLSKDYCDIARWRTADANERAKVLRRMEDDPDAELHTDRP